MTVTNFGQQRVFTTFEVGKICGVFHTTVINWVNKGKLRAHLTPGGHRRIELNDLIDFMRHYDMPIPDDLATRNKKALIVEDDAAVQRMLLRTLQQLGSLELFTCAGGLEALMVVGKESPDLVVLDIRIPQVDGLEVCKLLRNNEQTRPIRVIAVTGESLTREEEVFLKHNADRFFRKPISTAEFRRAAAILLELESAAQRG